MLIEGVSEADQAVMAKEFGGLYGGSNAVKRYTSKVIDPNTGEVIAMAFGSVYDGDLSRASQWDFGANRDRRLWVDSIFSKRPGCGSVVLAEIEAALAEHADEVPKPNIYVMSLLSSTGFYDRKGYVGIDTPDHADDEDYPSSFLFGSCVGWWMAKPLGDALCGETEYPIPGDHGGKATRWAYARQFTDPAPPMRDMIYFFEYEYEEPDDTYVPEAELDGWLAAMCDRLADPKERDRVASNIGVTKLLASA